MDLMSSFLMPMLEPLMVTEMRPFRGPKRGRIWDQQNQNQNHQQQCEMMRRKVGVASSPTSVISGLGHCTGAADVHSS